MRFSLGTLTGGRVPNVLGVCSTDTRLVQWANAAQERLMNCGRWYGTVVRSKFCVSDGCLVWPREVATIERVNLCNTPIGNSNLWYEFTEFVNPYCTDCCWSTDPRLVALSDVSTISDIDSSKKVLVIANAADAGKYIYVKGYDENGAWVRTSVGGTVIDGERITLAASPGTVGAKIWKAGGITAIHKDVTDYDVLMYQYDPTTLATEQLLGRYQPSEEYPLYRRSNLKNIGGGCCCKTTDANGDPVYTVEAIVSLQHVPVSGDEDLFVLQNQHALELGMQALKLEEDGKDDDSEVKWRKAIRELQRQNEKYWPSTNARIITTGYGSAHPARLFANFH